MIVILCIDDAGGMMFNKRRQSRDRKVIEDIMTVCEGRRLWIHPFSEKLFISTNDQEEKRESENIQLVSDENLLENAKESEYCFIENVDLKSYIFKIERLILYKWNRRYPADQYLDIDLEKWEKIESVDMSGNSHEKITREIYVRGK